ncbi:MAG: hypothetical protein KDA69_16360 [Planctomycetaceae bacterium]|nr:hypothetical protein [Planctomycetaceae bacterium]MCB9949352.1 hypothetical protein [Planctomycetaceae bacterium]
MTNAILCRLVIFGNLFIIVLCVDMGALYASKSPMGAIVCAGVAIIAALSIVAAVRLNSKSPQIAHDHRIDDAPIPTIEDEQ